MTIYDIKRLSENDSPYFFSTKTLKFFGQTMRSFSIKKLKTGNYYISAPIKDRRTGKTVGKTERVFNVTTKKLEHVNVLNDISNYIKSL